MDGGPSEYVQHLYLYGSVTTRFYRMYKKFGIRCVKYMDPIDLIDHPWNMEIDLYLCWKETNNKRTLHATNHLIIDLETSIAWASMIYITYLYTYNFVVFCLWCCDLFSIFLFLMFFSNCIYESRLTRVKNHQMRERAISCLCFQCPLQVMKLQLNI